jgi:hypothetical protein
MTVTLISASEFLMPVSLPRWQKGVTSLIAAVQNNGFNAMAVVQLLLEHKADPSAADQVVHLSFTFSTQLSLKVLLHFRSSRILSLSLSHSLSV